MIFLKLRNIKLIFLSLVGLPCLVLGAADLNPEILNPHLLPKAVQIRVSPRGMGYFEKNLTHILGNIGVNLDEGYFPAMTYTMDKPIKPDDIKDTNSEGANTYKQITELLSTWLVGFSLNPHLLSMKIGESGYSAQFSRFALVTDENVMQFLGKKEGAVLAIELELKKLTLSTASILAWDLNNEFLGTAGLENVSITLGDETTPLKIRLPFYVHMNAAHSMEFEALEIDNNLNQTAIDIHYQKLIVPTFAVEVNGKKFYLNNQELDKILAREANALIDKVRTNLDEFTRKSLPDILNKKAKEYFNGTLEQVQDMSPPGKEISDNRPDFKWGLRLDRIDLNTSLIVDVNAYVEDTLNLQSSPLRSAEAHSEVLFNLLATDQYDVAMSIDRSLINRVMQLSFERKNFEKIESEGTLLRLVAPPTIDFANPLPGVTLTPQETFVKLHVSIENQPHSIFLKKDIILNFDIIAKLAQVKGKEGLQLILLKIDANSMTMNPHFLSVSGKLLNSVLKNKVYEGIRNTLRELSAQWETTQSNIPGSLPLPPDILGIRFQLNRLQMDRTGHLAMYLDYNKKVLQRNGKIGVKK